MWARLLLTSSVILAAAVWAGEQPGAGIRIESAWARRAPMLEGSAAKAGSGNGAVYAVLVNQGKGPDALISAASAAAGAAEIHETYRDMGMMMMRPVSKLDLPAGRKLELKPGGYHIMLVNLKRELKPGEAVDLTLVFEKAGKIPVRAEIR
jgi:copper(I)-binding protein